MKIVRLVRCAACGALTREGIASIHRDGFDVGPEVDLCHDCGAHETPTCEELWKRIAERRTAAGGGD